MNELPVSTLKQIIFGDDLDLDKSSDVDELPNEFEKLKHDGAVRAALGKSSDVSCILDLSPPPDNDVDCDDAVLYQQPKIVRGVSSALRKTSDDKFVKAIATIRRVFAGHDEEMAEAIEIASRIRNEARAEAIASA